MEPNITPTSSLPSPSATFQRLESAYGQQVQDFTHSAKATYVSHLFPFQVASVIISAALFAGGVYFLIRTSYIAIRIDRVRDVILRKDETKRRARSSWEDIERHFFAGDDNDLRIAIIEADNLLDEALRGAGVQGSQVGDRLKRIRPEMLPNLEDVWQAHKLRNRIAHETNFVMKRDLAERALTVYQTALAHLGLLEDSGGLTEPPSHLPPSP